MAIDPALKDYIYSGESYDAVNLIALAAEAAKSTKGTEAFLVLGAGSEWAFLLDVKVLSTSSWLSSYASGAFLLKLPR